MISTILLGCMRLRGHTARIEFMLNSNRNLIRKTERNHWANQDTNGRVPWELDSTGSGLGPVAQFCENGNEYSYKVVSLRIL
jgi:hypothetical protein